MDSYSDFLILPGYFPILISMFLFPSSTYDGSLILLMFKDIQIIIDDEVNVGNVVVIGFSGILEFGSSVWWSYLKIDGSALITLVY